MTYKQLEDASTVNQEQIIAIPDIEKIKCRGKRVKDDDKKSSFIQGSKVTAIIPVQLEQLPPDTVELAGVAYGRLYYNRKPILKTKNIPFKMLQGDIDQGGIKKVAVPVRLPQKDELEDTCRGGKWVFVAYVKLEGMPEIIKKRKGLRVFNNKKQFTPLQPTQDPDVLDSSDNSEITIKDDD